MGTQEKPVVKADAVVKAVRKSKEELARARADRDNARLRRDRVRALDTAQTCLRRAGAALASGDEADFGRWVDAASASMGQSISLATYDTE